MCPFRLTLNAKYLAAVISLFGVTGVVAGQSLIPPSSFQLAGDAGRLRSDIEWALGYQEVYLAVTLNGVDTGKVLPFSVSGTQLLASTFELESLGIPVSDAYLDPAQLIPIDSLAYVTYRLDRAAQQVDIHVAPEALPLSRYSFHEYQTHPRSKASFGSVLNYDLYAARNLDADEDSDRLSAFLDYRVFGGGMGTLSTTGLSHFQESQSDYVRLDTTWVYSDHDSLAVYSAGDVISSNLSWTRGVRLGGIQFRRSFDLRPRFISSPVPVITGTAALPSVVDVYVNNFQQYSRNVNQGGYQISDLPVVTGDGQLQVYIEDALGRRQISTQSFYSSSEMLSPGLWDYSFEVGSIRSDYGVESSVYENEIVASASVRNGVTSYLSLEGHVEGGYGLTSFGAGGVLAMPGFGQTSLFYSQSEFRGYRGEQVNLEHRYVSQYLSLFLSSVEKFEDFLDLASLTGAQIPKKSRRASLSIPLAGYGTIGASYLSVESDPDGPFMGGIINCQEPFSCLPIPQATARFNNYFYSVQFSNQLSLHLSAFHNLESSETGVTAGLSWYFGRGTSSSLSSRHDERGESHSATVRKNTPNEGRGMGWSATASEGVQEYRQAELAYRGDHATAGAGWSRFGDYSQANLQARGAVAFIARDVFLSNPIYDSFAVVDTGLEGVQVLHENRRVGRTGLRGKYFLPNISSIDVNRVAIDPTDMPVDAMATKIEETVLPMDRTGVVLHLPIKRMRAAQVVLVDHLGKHLPLGSSVTLLGSDQQFVVGYDGIVYIDRLEDRNILKVTTESGLCAAQFDYTAERGKIPVIGPIFCKRASFR